MHIIPIYARGRFSPKSVHTRTDLEMHLVHDRIRGREGSGDQGVGWDVASLVLVVSVKRP